MHAMLVITAVFVNFQKKIISFMGVIVNVTHKET